MTRRRQRTMEEEGPTKRKTPDEGFSVETFRDWDKWSGEGNEVIRKGEGDTRGYEGLVGLVGAWTNHAINIAYARDGYRHNFRYV